MGRAIRKDGVKDFDKDVALLTEMVKDMLRNGFELSQVRQLELMKYDWPGYPDRIRKRRYFLKVWYAAFPVQRELFKR